jgi:hypothetical protein
MTEYNKTTPSGYTKYNIPNSVKDLDRNTIDYNDATVFPARLYSGAPFRSPYHACDKPRDTRTSYFIGKDRDDHPDHFSTFGYANCPNGYCLGIQTKGYIMPSGCLDGIEGGSLEPQDIAPARFYQPPYVGPYGGASQTHNESYLARNNICFNQS